MHRYWFKCNFSLNLPTHTLYIHIYSSSRKIDIVGTVTKAMTLPNQLMLSNKMSEYCVKLQPDGNKDKAIILERINCRHCCECKADTQYKPTSYLCRHARVKVIQ